jgi:hypothetical protein
MRAIAIAGVVLMFLAVAFFVAQGRVTLRIPEAQAQSLIDARLPLRSQSAHHSYELTRVKLTFLDGDKVHVDCQFALEFLGRTTQGTVSGVARPVYRDAKFFLEDFEVEKLDVGRIELTDRPNHERTIKKLAAGFLSSVPIYEVRSWKKLFLREVRVERGVLIAVLDPTTSWKLSFQASSQERERLWALVGPRAPSPSAKTL